MCRLTHKTQGGQGCDCKVTQDIVQKGDSKMRNSLQNVGVAKSRWQLNSVNLKVNVQKPPRGVDVTKQRFADRKEHHEKTKVQSGQTAVNHKVNYALDKPEGPKNLKAEARMKPPKDTTVLQFGHWPHQKVNTVSQIAKTFLRMSWTTRFQICKVDRRSRSRCADFTTRVVRYQNEVAKLDKTSNEKFVQK